MEHIIGQGNNMRMNMPQLGSLPVVKCNICGSISFENVYLIRVLSALQSPDGQEHIIPEPTFRCTECKTFLGGKQEEVEIGDRDGEDTNETENNESSEEPGNLRLV